MTTSHMPPLSALYVNVNVTPRPWLKRATQVGGWLIQFVGRFSDRGANLVARGVLSLCVRFGYVVEVRR